MEREAKAIYCPQCHRRVATYDGKSKINSQEKCHKCNRLVIYDIASDTVIIKKMPERSQCNPVRFW